MSHEREVHWNEIAAQMDKDVQAFYSNYPGQSVLASLRELLPPRLNEMTILDIGCGTGRYFPFFASLGAGCLVGVDIGENLLAICQRGNPVACLALANAIQLPFADQSFDVVLSMGLIEHFKDPVPLLIEFTRLVRSGGILVLETPNVLNPAFTLYKIVHRRRLIWERWLGPWNLLRLVRKDPQLTPVRLTSSIMASWLLTRLVGKANRRLPGVAAALVQVERLWPFRYLGSMMFVSARRR